jgi:hypothetical protein
MGACAYLDNTPVTLNTCAVFTPSQSSDYTARNYIGIGIGEQNNVPPPIPSNNEELFVQKITFWEPPSCSWQTAQCNTQVYSGP